MYRIGLFSRITKISVKTLDAVPKAECVMHKGPYDGLPLA